eukprot:gnl/Chilomastix_caulleri/1921.p1 GENE.gnl/Chilomastix_caulleri/1921~~gnl/Chilomastix_caulleri/1921.p1  ORF type:complete len:137 (+),score=21.54 gnl/Chilomastix_caulleri/1921:79-489(+)
MSHHKTSCKTVPTPKNMTKKGVKHFKAFIWIMFAIMLAVFLTTVPMAFIFGYGCYLAPNAIIGLVFAILFTPGKKRLRESKLVPGYSSKLSIHIGLIWTFCAISIVTGIPGYFMFYNGEHYYNYCYHNLYNGYYYD